MNLTLDQHTHTHTHAHTATPLASNSTCPSPPTASRAPHRRLAERGQRAWTGARFDGL